MRLARLTLLTTSVLLPAYAAQAQPAADPAAIWTIQLENASLSFGSPVDRLYTNGMDIGWVSPTGMVPDFLADLGRTLWDAGQQRVGIDISQQMYTPIKTSLTIPNPYDRPYAGALLGNFTLMSDADDSRSVLTLTLGQVGPNAGAEWVQDNFHNLIGQGHDKGWSYQIGNTPVVELLHERTWRLPIASFGGLETDALPSLTVGIGDLRDYVQTGVVFRLGQGLGSDFGVPRLRPGLSGSAAYVPTQPFAWYIFAGGDGQAVGYDLLLDSKPFRTGPHVSSIWDVAEMQGGFAVMAYGMRLTFAYVAQTQEFAGQSGGLHQFGSASLSLRF